MKRSRKDLKLMVLFCFLSMLSQVVNADRPLDSPPISYSDISNFRNAYQSLDSSADKASILQADYLDKASLGLEEYAERFEVTAESLVTAVENHPHYFASLQNLEDVLRQQEPDLVRMFGNLESILPGTEVPTVYYVVGGMSAGGNGGEGNYVLIGADRFARKPDTDMSEFKPGTRLFEPTVIQNIVAHEVTHVIQESIQGEKYIEIYTDKEKGTLLAYALREGGADFFAQLLSGGHINETAHRYGDPREEELWKLFREQMNSTDLGDWFFYAPKQHPEWPKDLGYWMGFKIVQYYYENAADKHEAIMALLSATDYPAFFEKTNYAQKFEK